jgi:hypothetical protein
MNWSTTAGDLRVSHAVGLHALQVLPLAGYLMSHWLSRRASMVATALFAALYAGFFAWTFVQAIDGRPVLAKVASEAARPLTFHGKVT